MKAIMNRNKTWDDITLSDPMTIRGLIANRVVYDKLHEYEVMGGDGIGSDLCDMSDTIICVYADLDNLIKKTRFTKVQKEILDLHMIGYTTNEISEYTKTEKRSVENALNLACESISETNYQHWKLNYVFWNKKRVATDFKQCSKCKEFLPMTEEYFRQRIDGYGDGFYNNCRECENIQG